MKKLFLILAFMLLVKAGYSFPTDTLSGDITGTVTLSPSYSYLLIGEVKVQPGGALVIPPGTHIYGDETTKGSIIVLRGGIIYAKGTANDPIVFTSPKPIGQRGPGDWGGIVLLGRARINTTDGADTAAIEGFANPIYYGGNNDDDSSGCLSYVRIEYAGIALAPNNEINSLTMGGVGRKTQIDHIQVSYAGDDAYEWFGGTVNCYYLVAAYGVDDIFDTDNGFRGRVQFCLGISDPNIADVSTSNGFESDNNGGPNYNNPRTQSWFSNVTLAGPREYDTTVVDPLFGRGMHLRRNSLQSVINTIWMGWTVGTRFDGAGVGGGLVGDTTKYYSNIIARCNKIWDTTGGISASGFDPIGFFANPTNKIDTFNTVAEVMLTNPYSGLYNKNYSGSDFIPLGGSPALTDFMDPSLVDPAFMSADYRGAFGTTDWTADWTNFRPDTVDYNVGINQISSNVPERFTLSQNYPNPFNPSTKINFSVPAQGFVTLKIYNSLGQLVANLVNQELSVGVYEYDFNAASLSSGIYFYTLTGDNFVETKRMMLIK